MRRSVSSGRLVEIVSEESKSKGAPRNIIVILFILVANALIAGILIQSFFFSN